MIGRRWGGALSRRVAVLCCVALLAACGDDGSEARQEPEPAVIGFLRAVATGDATNQDAMLAELAAAGYRQGENLTVLGADPDEAHADPADAARVVTGWRAQGLDLVIALSSSGAKVAAETAPELNVLFLSTDPVAVGLVENERRPEGRLTGATFRVPADRTLDLARRMLPGLDRMGLLYPPADPSALPGRANAQRAAKALGIELIEQTFATDADAATAVRGLEQKGVDAILLPNSPTTSRASGALSAALASSKVPAIGNTIADYVLFVLEPDGPQLYRQMGRQAARLLGGTPVAEVPVEDPGGFRIVINDDVATRLGITVPPDIRREATAAP